MALSRRAAWEATGNALSVARNALVAEGRKLLDLTVSNPTKAGLPYPLDELAGIMADAAREPYSPDPMGLLTAREAVAQHLSSPGDLVSPDDIVLTASTSEAYGFLFRLLTDPGDVVHTTTPAYPLLEHLAALDAVQLDWLALEFHPRGSAERWSLDVEAAASRLHERSRAIALVHPNNPTGSYLSPLELTRLDRLSREREVAIISDEVFHPYHFAQERPPSAAAGLKTGLVFALGGLSKSAGLPHYKLGWIRVGGDPGRKREALRGLELIGDTYLSVSTPVQAALPRLFPLAATIQGSIRKRLLTNLAAAARVISQNPAVELLPVQGGWSLVLRYPDLITDEALALRLMQRQGVMVQPGYFFDFPAGGFLVLSLLTEEEVFLEGVSRIMEELGHIIRGDSQDDVSAHPTGDWQPSCDSSG